MTKQEHRTCERLTFLISMISTFIQKRRLPYFSCVAMTTKGGRRFDTFSEAVKCVESFKQAAGETDTSNILIHGYARFDRVCSFYEIPGHGWRVQGWENVES